MFNLPKPANLILATALLLVASVISCKKIPESDARANTSQPTDSTNNQPTDTTKLNSLDFTTKVSSSLSGFVKVTNVGAPSPVDGAKVSFGNKNTITDKYGYFEIKDAVVLKEAAQVTISKTGFYTNYKTFITGEGKSIFTRINLLIILGGRFSAASGGSFEVDGLGSFITIPPNALIDEATNTLYSGFAGFHSTIIGPGDEEMSVRMPGDLRGLDTLGHLKLLSTYGIGNYVLVGENGEKLQLAKGLSATITIPLYSYYYANGPATIPLWNYDEATGLWKQQGRAEKSAFKYEGSINRLGYWNFATASKYIYFTGRLVSKSREPVPFAAVNISSPSAPDAKPVWLFSDADGYFSGLAQANNQLSLDLYAFQCGKLIFSKNFTTAQSDISFGDIPIDDNRVVSVNSTLTGCGGSVVTNGFLMMLPGNDYCRFKTDSHGTVHFNTLACDFNYHQRVVFIPEEIPTMQTGDRISVELIDGNNDLGNLSVCGTTDVVKFNCRLIDNSGNPLKNVFVQIAAPAAPFLGVNHLVSNSSGMIAAFIQRNTDYLLTVYGSLQCSNPIYSINFSTTNRDTSIGNLTLSNFIMAQITGLVVDCNNNPLTSGYVILQKDHKGFQYPLSNSGTFNFSTTICDANSPEIVTLIAEGNTMQQSGNPVNINVSAGNNDAGILKVCFDPATAVQFVDYTIDGTDHHSHISPPDSIRESYDPTLGSMIYINANNIYYDNGILFNMSNLGIGVGSKQSMEAFGTLDLRGPAEYPAYVTITEYGAVGGFIGGNFAIKVEESASPHTPHVVTCSFRVRRNQ